MDRIEEAISVYLEEKRRITDRLDIEDIEMLARDVIDTYCNNGHVFILANGGTAGTVEHLVTDLAIHPFVSEDKKSSTVERKLKVHNLCSSVATITGVSNDLGFDNIFKAQLESYKDELSNSLVIAFSASGNSANVVEALKYARNNKAMTTCVTGGDDTTKAFEWCDNWIVVPGNSMFPGQTGSNNNCFHIEDFFMSIGHMLTGLLKQYIEEAVHRGIQL
jgi:D-sedoheptulose 7-phosphate isomerase